MVFTGHRSLAERVGVWFREGKAALWEEGDVPRPSSSFHSQTEPSRFGDSDRLWARQCVLEDSIPPMWLLGCASLLLWGLATGSRQYLVAFIGQALVSGTSTAHTP